MPDFDPANPFTSVVPAEQHDASIREASARNQQILNERAAELVAKQERKHAAEDRAQALRQAIQRGDIKVEGEA